MNGQFYDATFVFGFAMPIITITSFSELAYQQRPAHYLLKYAFDCHDHDYHECRVLLYNNHFLIVKISGSFDEAPKIPARWKLSNA
jgi:hypothetical protein